MKIVSGETRQQATVEAVLSYRDATGGNQRLAIMGDVPEGADPREHALKYMRAVIIQKASELAEACATYTGNRTVAVDEEILGVDGLAQLSQREP